MFILREALVEGVREELTLPGISTTDAFLLL